MNYDRLRPGLRREVAFVAHTDDLAIQTQGEENLSGRRK
jgi:hypothetical protein